MSTLVARSVEPHRTAAPILLGLSLVSDEALLGPHCHGVFGMFLLIPHDALLMMFFVHA